MGRAERYGEGVAPASYQLRVTAQNELGPVGSPRRSRCQAASASSPPSPRDHRQVTEILGDHGVYAVFLLMLVDAVFPAASELVMLYARRARSRRFRAGVVLFGVAIDCGFGAYVAIALAGTIGYRSAR